MNLRAADRRPEQRHRADQGHDPRELDPARRGDIAPGETPLDRLALLAVDLGQVVGDVAAAGAPRPAVGQAAAVEGVLSQRGGFDVDRAGGGTLNTYLRLFNSGGTQLTANDNAAAPGETGNNADSYLVRTFTTAGTYYLAVSNSANKSYSPTTGGGGDVGGGGIGSYKLSLVNLPAAGVAALRAPASFVPSDEDEERPADSL